MEAELIAVILGVIASFIAIFSFITGRNSLNEILNTRKELEHLNKENERLNQKISIVLRETDGKRREINLPSVLRSELTRAEIQGRVGCIPTNTKQRYQVEYFVTKEYFDNLDQYYTGTITEPFEIPLGKMYVIDKDGNRTEQTEYDQFDLSGSAWKSTISPAI